MNMQAFTLSKSTYIRGLQCLKSLYLNKHRPFLRDKLSEEQLAKFSRGHEIGKLARQLFPGGIDIPRPSVASANRTQQEIVNGTPVIYEACFIHSEIIIAVDILVKHENGWNAYEVKSSRQLSETYFSDARLQEYVIRGTGIHLYQFFLVYRDISFEMSDTRDIHKLFIYKELPESDLSMQLLIESDVSRMKAILQLPKSPDIQAGKQCMSPYPCDFRGVCWKNLTEDEKSFLSSQD